MSYLKGAAVAVGLAGFVWGVWWLVGYPIRWESALAGSAVVGWIAFFQKGKPDAD